MASSTATLAQLLIVNKPQILRNKLHIVWNYHHHHHNRNALLLLSQLCARGRSTWSPLLLLPPRLHLPHHHLPIRHPHLRPPPPLPPLPRPCPRHMSSLASPTPPPPDSSTPTKTVKLVIKGRVQGVFYRNWTVDNATELGLKGWVRNRRDGSVEALFSGSDEKVAEMQERCRRGPPSAVVTGLDVFPSTEDPGRGFERRSTV